MEKQARQTRSSRTTAMKTTFCIPRYRPTTRKTTRLSPMTLLDRFREAVFRLIMISALSKAASTTTTSSAGTTPQRDSGRSSSSSSNSPAANNRHRAYHYYHSNDPYHSEAVADCIEFIKKSSANDHIHETTTRDSMDSTAEVVIPLPVM